MSKQTFKDGSVLSGSTNLQVTEANLQEEGKFVPIADTETAQVDDIMTDAELCTQKWLTGDCTADFDPDRPPRDDPPNIKVGALVTLVLNETASRQWSIPAIVKSFAFPSLKPDGKITWKFGWKSQGAWTEPS